MITPGQSDRSNLYHLNNRRIVSSRFRRIKKQGQGSECDAQYFQKMDSPAAARTPSVTTKKESSLKMNFRSDKYHTPILRGLKMHRVSFCDQIKGEVSARLDHIFIVENWKRYNQDKEEPSCCCLRRCSIF